MKQALIVTLIVIGIFLLWEIWSIQNPHFAFVLPSPSKVWARLLEKSDRFLFHSAVTLQEIVIGFVLALTVAFPVAWAMNVWSWARVTIQPLVIIIQCIPVFTLAPLMIIWFGWSLTAIIIPTAMTIFFPLTISIYQGFRSTPQYLLDYFRINGAKRWQTFFKLQLPWSLPHIFGGFRLSASIAGIAAVAAEWGGAQAGLGVLLIESRRDIDLETNFGALFCLAVLSCSLYLLIVGIEYWTSQRRFSKSMARVACIMLPLIACVALTGCQKQEHPVGHTRLLLDWFPNPNHIPLYVGISKGFFADKGIDLELQKLQDPSHATPYLSSGQCDLALSYMPHTIRMNRKNAGFKPVGILVEEPLLTLIYREGESIRKLEDLNGKTIGLCTGGGELAFLNAILDGPQIAPAETINVGFDLISCLQNKRVDALYEGFWNIEVEHLRDLGLDVNYFSLDRFGVPTYCELIVLARHKSPQAEEPFVSKFQEALQSSIDYAVQHPDEAFEIYIAAQPDKSSSTQRWEKKAWEKTAPVLATSQQFSPVVWKEFEAWLEKHHLLD